MEDAHCDATPLHTFKKSMEFIIDRFNAFSV
jgi:hypothetical protein